MSEITNSDEATAIKLSATDVKNKAQLIEEVQSFATMLHQRVRALESECAKTRSSITLTFACEDAESLALTLHQLLWVFKENNGN